MQSNIINQRYCSATPKTIMLEGVTYQVLMKEGTDEKNYQ